MGTVICIPLVNHAIDATHIKEVKRVRSESHIQIGIAVEAMWQWNVQTVEKSSVAGVLGSVRVVEALKFLGIVGGMVKRMMRGFHKRPY